MSQDNGIAGVGENWIRNDLKTFDIEECPECKSPLDDTENPPFKELCSHIRCLQCWIKKTPCHKCERAQPASPSRKVTANGSVTSTSTPPIHKSTSVPAPTPCISSPKVYGATKSNNEGSASTATARDTKSLPLRLLKTSRSPPKELSPPVSVSETPMSSELLGSNEQKKKRSPVVIHDHITVISGEPPMFQCNVCKKKFKTKAHIKYHEFCQNGEKPFKCGQCGRGFIAKSHYEYHLRTHTGERPYVCLTCGKGFNQRGKVTRHMRSHTGEKPFVCGECGRGFANAQTLRSHHLIHTGERPFACKYCNKRFTGMTNLKKHIITHTGERPYVCTHCGKSFGLKWTLDLHLRTHSRERPYACDQCTRAFSNSKDLRRHLVIHSGQHPFTCWICNVAFRRKDNLNRHITNIHNQPKEVAKQLANEAAAKYLAIGNSPATTSKVNSSVILKVIRTAQLNGPQPMKIGSGTKRKKLKKAPLSVIVEEPSTPKENEVTAALSTCDAVEKIEQEDSNSPADDYFVPSSPIISSASTMSLSPISQFDIEGTTDAASQVIMAHLREENTKPESFDNYILPNIEDSFMRFTSGSAAEEILLHTETPHSKSFVAFTSQCEAEQKLHTETPGAIHGYSDFSKSRSLIPSDCGIRIFDEACSPTDSRIDLTSIIAHASGDEDSEQVFVDEKETQTIVEELNGTLNTNLKILVGRARSIFPEGDDDMEESYHLHDKKANPKDEDVEREEEPSTQTKADETEVEDHILDTEPMEIPEISGDLGIVSIPMTYTVEVSNLEITNCIDIKVSLAHIVERVELGENTTLKEESPIPATPNDADIENQLPDTESEISGDQGSPQIENQLSDTEPMEIPEISGDLGDPAFPKTESPKLELLVSNGEKEHNPGNEAADQIKLNEGSAIQTKTEKTDVENQPETEEDPDIVSAPNTEETSAIENSTGEKTSHDHECEPVMSNSEEHNHDNEAADRIKLDEESTMQSKTDKTEVENQQSDPETEEEKEEDTASVPNTEETSKISNSIGEKASHDQECDPVVSNSEDHDPDNEASDHVKLDEESTIQSKTDEKEVENQPSKSKPEEDPDNISVPNTETSMIENSNEEKGSHHHDCDELEENLVISEDIQRGPIFYSQQNPGEPYTGNMYYPSQISVDHPYSPNNQQQNMNLVYATTTAEAERNDDSGPPLKVHILDAEALDVQSHCEDLDRRINYAGARPNQLVGDYSSSSLVLSAPTILHPPEGHDGSPQVTLRQYRYEQQQDASSPSMAMQSQYPVEVAYDNDGIVHAQTVCAHPDRFITSINRAREISRDLQGTEYYHRDWNVPEPFVRPIIYASNQQNSQVQQNHPRSHQQAGAQYYGQVPNVQEPIQDIQPGPSQGYSIYNPRSELTAEATRRLYQISEERYDDTMAAAAALAIVGEQARKQREEELKNREMRRQLLDSRLRIHEDLIRENRRKSAASRKS